MKCEDCRKVLEEYFDGELDERSSRAAREHLLKCEACAREFEALRDEQNLYALYRREAEVTPTLWTGVAARIQEEKRREESSPVSRWKRRLTELFGTPRLSPALTFALLILAVGATAGLMKYMQSRNASSQPVAKTLPPTPAPPAQTKTGDEVPAGSADPVEPGLARNENQETSAPDEKREVAPAYRLPERVESRRGVAAQTVGFTDEASPDQLVREAEQKYRAAIAMLARDARRRRTLLEPDVQARFDQTLAAVDRTISETRMAVRQQPDDPVAVQYMLAAYAKKVEVLREMASPRSDERDVQDVGR